MRKKRSPRKKPGKNKNIHSEPMPDRRAMDKMMADVTRLIQEQEFDSIDEINAYLQQMMNSGEPIPRTVQKFIRSQSTRGEMPKICLKYKL